MLTQSDDSMEKVLAYASHRWSVSDARKSATDRECLAIIWSVMNFSYVQVRPFTLITDCAALTRLFKSQALSAKYHRWALQLTELEMELEWRPGTRHQLADALSRIPRASPRGEGVEDSFPGRNTREKPHRLPEGPILDGVPLSQLGVEVDEDDEGRSMAALSKTPVASMVVLAAVAFTPSTTQGVEEEVTAVVPMEPIWKPGQPTSTLPRTVVFEYRRGGIY